MDRWDPTPFTAWHLPLGDASGAPDSLALLCVVDEVGVDARDGLYRDVRSRMEPVAEVASGLGVHST